MRLKLHQGAIYTLVSAILIAGGTLAAIQYAKGNFRLTKSGFVPESGLLSANSFPTGAQVYVNDKLITATDDTIYLEPGDYQVKIVKEGYSPWEKTLHIEKELVTQTSTLLFPLSPKLAPLTFSGVENVWPSPDGQKVIFYTASTSAEAKRGLYILDLSSNPLPIQRGPRQISSDTTAQQLATASIIWSPDSSELLVANENREVLLASDKLNTIQNLPDISFQKKTVLSKWQSEMYQREREFLSDFPDEMIQIATQSARNVYLSPDKDKMLYTAVTTVTIPEKIIPPVPATNTQPETRTLKPGSIYVYDKVEDKNFLVGTDPTFKPTILDQLKKLLATDLYSKDAVSYQSSPSAFTSLQATTSAATAFNYAQYHTSLVPGTIQWFPDSKHLIYTKQNEIHIVGYDGTNDTLVYSGPFADNFVYPWPDGSKLIIRTAFSSTSPLNLYAIELQ